MEATNTFVKVTQYMSSLTWHYPRHCHIRRYWLHVLPNLENTLPPCFQLYERLLFSINITLS